MDRTAEHLSGTFAAHPPDRCPGPPTCEQAVPDSAGFVHILAEVESGARIGAGTRVWRWTLIRADVRIGRGCRIGSGCIIGPDVVIGDECKIEDGAKLYGPLVLGDGVFIGPGVVLTNDRHPRARQPDGKAWKAPGPETVIEEGASVGANAVVLPGVRIGRNAMVGAGQVVVGDVSSGCTYVRK